MNMEEYDLYLKEECISQRGDEEDESIHYISSTSNESCTIPSDNDFDCINIGSNNIPASHIKIIAKTYGKNCDLYRILNISRTTSQHEIRTMYFRFGQKLLAALDDEDMPDDEKLEFEANTIAWDILSNSIWRLEYDMFGLADEKRKAAILLKRRAQQMKQEQNDEEKREENKEEEKGELLGLQQEGVEDEGTYPIKMIEIPTNPNYDADDDDDLDDEYLEGRISSDEDRKEAEEVYVNQYASSAFVHRQKYRRQMDPFPGWQQQTNTSAFSNYRATEEELGAGKTTTGYFHQQPKMPLVMSSVAPWSEFTSFQKTSSRSSGVDYTIQRDPDSDDILVWMDEGQSTADFGMPLWMNEDDSTPGVFYNCVPPTLEKPAMLDHLEDDLKVKFRASLIFLDAVVGRSLESLDGICLPLLDG